MATGTVEVSLGIRSAAIGLDLDFVPLTWEDFDIALIKNGLDPAAHLIAVLRTPSLREKITALGGYDTSRSGQVTELTGTERARR